MWNELFVAAFGLSLALFFYWSFRTLPGEKWQIIGSVPVCKEGSDQWRGHNFTYYGLLVATAVVTATTLVFILMGSVGVPPAMTALVPVVVLSLCLPASKVLAQMVEKKPHTLTVGGATFLGIIVTPAVIWMTNRAGSSYFDASIPMIPALAAIAIAYAMGEGIGRLACISFGCCYGKAISECPPMLQRLLGRYAFVFMGKTKKIAYEGCLDGTKVVPIQAITCVIYVGTGLAALLFFLSSAFSVALILAMGTTQIWRIVSETLRADYRGGGPISAYQIMAGVTLVFAVAFAFFPEPEPLTAMPDIRRGLEAVWHPAMIIALQVLGIGVFLATGRSKVTGSLLSFHVLRDRI